uniref:Gag/pol polyprotein n=1 Tax=Solanum tuberosum TaxID=4113 RepID=M1DD38_SOLTU
MPPPQQGNYDPSRPRFEKKPARIFTPFIESRKKLFERLTAAGYIHPVGPKPVDISSKFYRPDQRCAYHSNSVGHDTKDCINLKLKIQDLIDQNVVSLQTVTPNVNSNPLPNHGGITINMIETDDEWCVTKTIVLIAPDELERVVASLCIREKKKFVILTPEKLVNATGDDLAPQPPMPTVYKMIATVMLQNDFEPGFGLGKYFQGIVEPIQIPSKGEKFGLGYVPTNTDKAEMKNKSIDQALARLIPYLYQSFPVRENVNDGGLGEGIWGLFEEIDAVIEEEAGHQASVMQNLRSDCRTGPPHHS